MNPRLKELYTSKWDKLTEHIQHINSTKEYSIKPSNPLLLNINEKEYEEADVRIMFFGQETNSWCGFFNPDFQYSIDNYRNFYLGGYAMNGYGGHFWNGINRLKKLFQERHPDKKLALVWNNIIKIGNEARNANRPPAYTYQVEREYFSVVREEIEILQPDVLVFFTGPNYDGVLTDNFGKLLRTTVPGFKQRALVQLNFSTNAFRTYHPRYLWMNDINKYLNAILDSIQLKPQPALTELAEETV